MLVEDNKAVVRGYLECVNTRDLAGLDAFFAPQLVANGQSLSRTEYIHLLTPLLLGLLGQLGATITPLTPVVG